MRRCDHHLGLDFCSCPIFFQFAGIYLVHQGVKTSRYLICWRKPGILLAWFQMYRGNWTGRSGREQSVTPGVRFSHQTNTQQTKGTMFPPLDFHPNNSDPKNSKCGYFWGPQKFPPLTWFLGRFTPPFIGVIGGFNHGFLGATQSSKILQGVDWNPNFHLSGCKNANPHQVWEEDAGVIFLSAQLFFSTNLDFSKGIVFSHQSEFPQRDSSDKFPRIFRWYLCCWRTLTHRVITFMPIERLITIPFSTLSIFLTLIWLALRREWG